MRLANGPASRRTSLGGRHGFPTIRHMESASAGPIAGRAADIQAVQAALEDACIQFLNGNEPRVRLRAKP